MEKEKYLGMDLHTNRFNFCKLNNENDNEETDSYEINENELASFIKTLDKNTYVLIESCANAFAIAKRIRPYVKGVFIGDTHRLRMISHSIRKSDKIDARTLAIVLKMDILSGYKLVNKVYIPEDEIVDLRALFTTYMNFNKIVVAVKNRIHSLLKQNLIVFPKAEITKSMISKIRKLDLRLILKVQIEFLIESLDQNEKLKEKIEEQIKIAGAKYFSIVEILTSIKGISVLSALAIIADIAADINRFPNEKHFCSYLRTAPGLDESNEKTKNKSVSKHSRKLTIQFLTQSISHFKNTNPYLKAWYNGKTKNVKKGKIRMGACRKMLVQIYFMLKNKEYHRYMNQANHVKKMNEYKNLLKRNEIAFEEKAA